MRIGIDLGGTKIEGIALADDGRELARRRIPTPRGDYDGTVAAIVDLVAELERDAGSRASVGIGTPGAPSRATGRMKNCNSTWLNDRPLPDDLSRALGREVRIANDADCLALSEATDGAAAGARTVFGVILGTGVGGGIVVDGRLLAGPNAIAGEWGHNPLPAPRDDERPGPPCYCGRRACIETFLSGPGFAADHRASSGRTATAEEVVALARLADPNAQAALARYVDRLARALATVINLLDPDVIVMGGGMSNVDELYADVPQRWGAHVFSDRVDTLLVRARYSDASGVRGAAWLGTS